MSYFIHIKSNISGHVDVISAGSDREQAERVYELTRDTERGRAQVTLDCDREPDTDVVSMIRAGGSFDWGNTHADDCPVTRYRGELTEIIRKDPGTSVAELFPNLPMRDLSDGELLGIVPEYMIGGDQEGEECNCSALPPTPQERELLLQLCGWALDQDHDAAGMGDPDYLYFLADEETGVDVDTVRTLLGTLQRRLSPARKES